MSACACVRVQNAAKEEGTKKKKTQKKEKRPCS